MIFTTVEIAGYLGMMAPVLLSEPPFNKLVFERSFDIDVKNPRIDYVLSDNGFDLVCNEDEKIRTIFFYADGRGNFSPELSDLPFGSSRQEVISRLGSPSKSGDEISDIILGEYGAWDRFECLGCVVHVEYKVGFDAVNRVTFMCIDSAP